MQRFILQIIGLIFCFSLHVMADETEKPPFSTSVSSEITTSEFEPELTPGEGFLTSIINDYIEKSMNKASSADEKPSIGRRLTSFASAPKFGGYFIGKYSYTDKDGEHSGEGFSQRFVRLYVDGTILTDFKYRIQMQTNNSSFHMKDFYVEWAHWKEFAVRVGQYKRAFLFENPYNPWDVGFGDYSQVVRKLSGMGDRCGEPGAAGGRDQGLQIQGDLFPSKADGHRYLHYQFQVMNGQGVNSSDENSRKDLIGSIQLQPIKDLFIGLFGWTGNYVSNGITTSRNRWAAAVKYEHDDWTFRAEYAHSQGHKISEYDEQTKTYTGRGRADGWYAALGVPCNDWLKLYAKYDVYRDQATWDTTRTMYCLAPNVQIHRNLMLQLQYNIVHDRTNPADKTYNELWAELYVRF